MAFPFKFPCVIKCYDSSNHICKSKPIHSLLDLEDRVFEAAYILGATKIWVKDGSNSFRVYPKQQTKGSLIYVGSDMRVSLTIPISVSAYPVNVFTLDECYVETIHV